MSPGKPLRIDYNSNTEELAKGVLVALGHDWDRGKPTGPPIWSVALTLLYQLPLVRLERDNIATTHAPIKLFQRLLRWAIERKVRNAKRY